MTSSADRSEALSFLLADRTGEMLLAVAEATFRIVAANETACRRLGYSRPQLIGMRIVDLDSTLPGSIFWQGIAAHRLTDVERSETEFRRGDGDCIPVERTVCPADHGGERYLLVAARDITDLRVLERRLDDATGILRSILESTAEGILALDLNGRVIGLNHAFSRMWQVPGEVLDAGNEVLLKYLVRTARVSSAVGKLLELDAIAGDATDSVTVEIGENRVLKLNSKPLLVAGAVAGRVYSCSDITELTRYEAQLSRQKEMLEAAVASRTAELAAAEAGTRLILESTAEGLIGLNRDGSITFINSAASGLLGYRTGELMGRNVHDAIHQPHPDGCQCAADECGLVRAIRDGRSMRADDEVFRRADGTSLPVSVAVHPMGAGEDSVGAVLSFSDTTLRRETEKARAAALAQAERLARIKGEFLANMSHEIRTPLNGVLGMAHVGYRKSEGRTEAREYFARIIGSGNLLMGIVNDILDFSKIDAGKLHIEPRLTGLAACLESCLALVRAQAEARKVTLHLDLSPDLPVACMIDSMRLEQILINLLSNAIKFTERGSVTLSLRRTVDRLVLSVKDTGIGMDPGQTDRIFEPFEQADGSTTRRFGGTGLGLSITRRLVELMNGEISVESAPGKGSRFEVSLPLTEAAPVEALAAGTTGLIPAGFGGRLAGLRILVAEDNEINQFVINDMLAEEGCEVVLVGDGQQAVDLVAKGENGSFDLILMDIQMPSMNGYEATRQIRNVLPEMPILALTAYALADVTEQSLEAGMRGMVSKPIDPEQLVHVVLHHTGRSAQAPVAWHAGQAVPVPDSPCGNRAGSVRQA